MGDRMATNVITHKACEHCGTVYAPPSNRSRFCSMQCKVYFKTKIDANGCWIWQGTFIKKSGYGTDYIESRSVTAHALSYTAFKGAIPPGLEVCHRCDVRACVRPEHLFLGTRAENMKDCSVKGRQWRKLSDDDVRAIRAADGVSKAELARRYGVTDVMIGKIIRREWWRHLPDNPIDSEKQITYSTSNS